MKLKSDVDAVSPVIGVILMVAITVVLAAVVWVMVMNITSEQQGLVPSMTLSEVDSGEYLVVSAPPGLTYSDLLIKGCTDYPTGDVTAGDEITQCTDELVIVHKPTNTIIYNSN